MDLPRQFGDMSKLMDMGRLGDLAAFEVQSRKTTSLDQLTNFLDSVVRQFGFRWFAMLHNVDLNRPGKNALLLTTYPSCWKDEIIATRLYMDDPVHAACSRTVFGLTWDRIGDYIQPTARQISILARGRAHGLGPALHGSRRMLGPRKAALAHAERLVLDVDAKITTGFGMALTRRVDPPFSQRSF